MTKEAAQFAAILKGWGPSLQRAVAKANANRWPSGAPGGKGGQFAPGSKGGGTAPYSTSKLSFQPGQMSLFSGITTGLTAPQYGIGKPPMMAGATKWLEPGEPAQPKPAPPGAKPHIKTDDYGKPVTINYPTKPSGPETWKNAEATATFVPGGPAPASLNGAAMKPWTNAPKTINEWANVEGQRPGLDADFPMEPAPGKSVGAGVIIQEPDGRIWLTKPTNHFGGYMQTFPKGTVENGLSLQASAIKEAYEETGLKVQITGVLGDYERTTSVARFYIARRVGGTPADMGWESQALRLAAPADLSKLLNMGVDKGILEDLRAEQFLKRAPLSLVRDREVIDEEVARRGLAWLYKAGKTPKGGAWQNQPRWPGGTPLGGQWKTMGADGLTQPPTIAGGLSGKNAAYQKKANAVHGLAQAGDLKSVLDYAVSYEKTVQASVAAGKKTSHVKWHAQLSQYTTQLVADMTAKPKAEASAAKLAGPDKLVASYTKVGAKPGGSNDGAVYADASGTKWLVKGNNYAATGGLAMSDDRAKNEVLASKLMSAAGIPGPEIKLVDLDGQHTGNLGVAVKWIDGLEKFNPTNAAQLAAVQNQFAVHAWLGNWDVLGMGLDNTAFKDGQAINIDPGGSILFRAQGAPKQVGAFDASASDWESMRSTDQHQKSVYGKMSQSQLQESAKQLATVTDETIRKLVDAHGPGDADAKAELAGKLIARRNAILTKAGLQAEAMKLAGVEVKQAEPAPPPAPPKIVDAVPAPANTPAPANIEKPAFNSGLPSDPYYQGLADKALALHQAGDLAGLKAMAIKKNGDPAWPAKTKHGKTMSGWHGALVSDLEGKHQTAINQVADGKAPVVDAKGQAWTADKGVLNPVGNPAKVAELKAKANEMGAAGDKGGLSAHLLTIGANLKDGVISQDDATQLFTHAGRVMTQLAEKDKAPTPTKKLSKAEMTAIADQFHPQPMSTNAYAMSVFAMEGNAAKVKAFQPQTPSEKNLKTHTLAAMTGGAAPTAPAKPDTIPGFSEAFAEPPKPALPDFEKQKLPSTNTNAGPHNAKVDQIKALAEKGDAAAILSLKFGTNTYAKKQVTLANDVLAALGSPHQVALGQKASAHPALVGGLSQPQTPAAPAVAAAKVAQAAAPAPPKKPKPTLADLTEDKLPAIPDVMNYKGPGSPYSSKQWKNDANIAALNAVKQAALEGGMPAVDKLSFPQLNAETGAPTGLKIPINEHPAKQLIGAYVQDVNNAINDFLNPPRPMHAFNVVSTTSVKETAAAFIGKKIGTTVNAQPKDQQFGQWVSLGNVADKAAVAPSQTRDLTDAEYKAGKKAYQGYSSLTKQWVGHVQSSGQINRAIDDGKNTYQGLDLKEVTKAIYKDATEFPAGTTLYRWQNIPPNMSKQIETAQEGLVFQSLGGFCTSKSPTATSHFGSHQITIRMAPGAKAIHSHGSGGFASEQEITTIPGQRYVLLGKKKVGNNWRIELLALPPDETFIG